MSMDEKVEQDLRNEISELLQKHQKQMTAADRECIHLRSEVARLRENADHSTCIQEIRTLNSQLAKVTQERDDWQRMATTNAMYVDLSSALSKLIASEVREIALRGALEESFSKIDKMVEYFFDDPEQKELAMEAYHLIDEALAAQDPPPLLGVLRKMKEALEFYAEGCVDHEPDRIEIVSGRGSPYVSKYYGHYARQAPVSLHAAIGVEK